MASKTVTERRRAALDRVADAANSYGIAVDALNDAAAKVLRVNRTDMRLIAVLRAHEALSPSELARISGLSPATISAAIGRLVSAGYAAQHRDPEDGRRSRVVLTDDARRALIDIYGGVLDAGRLHLRSTSVADLATIERFLRMAEGLQHDHALALLASPPDPRVQGSATARVSARRSKN